ISDFFDEKGLWRMDKRPGLEIPEESELLDNPEFRKAFYGCIDRLSERFRKVVTGNYLDTKESPELCQELGISASNLWQIIHRAKLQLRQCLNGQWFNHSES